MWVVLVILGVLALAGMAALLGSVLIRYTAQRAALRRHLERTRDSGDE